MGCKREDRTGEERGERREMIEERGDPKERRNKR